MRIPAVLLVLCLSLCDCSPVRPAPESSLPSPSRAPTYSVTVLATIGDERLPGVTVTAFPVGARPVGNGPEAAMTNIDGLAVLVLPAGHWCLAAAITGFVPIEIGVVISPDTPSRFIHFPLSIRPIGGDDFFILERVVQPPSPEPVFAPTPSPQANAAHLRWRGLTRRAADSRRFAPLAADAHGYAAQQAHSVASDALPT